MARLVRLEGTGPVEVKIGNESKWICTCGLSKNKPFCDGHHRACRDEDKTKLYRYKEDGTREEIKL